MADALLPVEMAQKAEEIGVKKAGLPTVPLLLLAVLACAFISIGAIFSTVALTGSAGMPFGAARVLGGFCFSLGLGMVVVGGAELFTGNNLITMAWASGKVSTKALLRNWALVYTGNTVGALGTALLYVLGKGYLAGKGQVGLMTLEVGLAKTRLGLDQAFFLGILCNALVCMAVWLSYSARSTADRLLAISLPVSAFVACGFEHSIANLYFLPAAWLIRTMAPSSFWALIEKSPEDYAELGFTSLLHNLLPVTFGNIIGGVVLVAAIYWGIYLRKDRVG